MWDLVNECGVYRLKGHKSEVTQVLFLPGEDIIVSRLLRGEERRGEERRGEERRGEERRGEERRGEERRGEERRGEERRGEGRGGKGCNIFMYVIAFISLIT